MSRAKLEDQKNQPPTFPDHNINSTTFKFGYEAEFLLVSSVDYTPLTYKELNFKSLERILNNILFDDLPGDFEPLEIESPMTFRSPFIVEGYGLTDHDFNVTDMLPKGIEIRTPVCQSIKDCLYTYRQLFARLKTELLKHQLIPVSLAHHPTMDRFLGPQNKRRFDWWQWAMQVMTTYGPDINISIPTHLLADFDLVDFDQKINFYGPALAAVGVGSPILKNKLWQLPSSNNRPHTPLIGKSIRTHKRSIIAPAIEYHPDEGNRFEFKLFDMTPYVDDIHGYFLCVLGLILDKNLKGRCDQETRIYELGTVAKEGLAAIGIKNKLQELLIQIKKPLLEHGFESRGLQGLENRVRQEHTLADEIIQIYKGHNGDNSDNGDSDATKSQGNDRGLYDFLSTIHTHSVPDPG